ncbi:hypothetical protein OE88DRAFT_1407881 [Heliocybe sulcata]|uniref:Uncharacterized protein n=1 Tax=Heliocybe sulcata TaxID=5364 RepID=A0A5C3N6N8_9AGAM|nr:hypothetical protein OE88DRAFT_1407881 [Heliocybe sulcata]
MEDVSARDRPESVIEEYILRPPRRRGPDKKTTPSPLLIARTLENGHSRSNSWVSMTTENELCAVAELMSPAVSDKRASFIQEPHDLPTVFEDSTDSEIDTPLPGDQDRSRRLSSLSMKAALSAVRPSSRGTSIYSLESGGDMDGEPTDEFGERAHLAAAHSAYPVFHLPRPRRNYTTSESDLPSLTTRTSISSTTSSLPGTPSYPSLSLSSSLHIHSPPASPLPIPSVEAQLAVIPEKTVEDDDQHRLSSDSEESLTAISFAPVEPSQRRALTLDISTPVSGRSETTFMGSPVSDIQMEPRHKQSILSMDSFRPAQAESVARWRRSPTPSTSSRIDSPTPRRSGAGSLRFFSLSAKSEKETSSARSIIPGGKQAITKDHLNDAKARKAEEKRRKKEESKARTEQLALQLKQRAVERKADAERQSLNSGQGRDKKDAVMYGGMVWM